MVNEWARDRFVRVLWGSLGHPKFLGLTAAERGTWLTALLLADIAHPGPVHEAAVLEKCPDATFERLYERELLEQNGRPGWFNVHDLRQFHVPPSKAPEAVKDRVARHRAKKKGAHVTTVTDVTAETDVTTDETRQDETRENDESRDSSVLRGTQSESRARAVVPRSTRRRPTRIGE